MSTPNFSNFISNFSGSSNIDIVSSVSDNIDLINGTSLYQGRYFCIGNLLIQFSDFSNLNGVSLYEFSTSGTHTIDFPYQYDNYPYTVILSGFNTTNNNTTNNNNVTVTLNSYTDTSFTFRVNSNSGGMSFLAIGPRPSSLYTS